MKRGVIYGRILASIRWTASAGLRCEFQCTATSAWWLDIKSPTHFSSSRFSVSRHGACCRTFPVQWPASAFYNARGCAGGLLHNERICICRVPGRGYFSTRACTALRSFHRTASDGAPERSRGGGFGTGAGTMGGNALGCIFCGGVDSYFDALDSATATAVRRAASLENPGGSADFSRTCRPMAGTNRGTEWSNQHERLFGEIFS